MMYCPPAYRRVFSQSSQTNEVSALITSRIFFIARKLHSSAHLRARQPAWHVGAELPPAHRAEAVDWSMAREAESCAQT